MKPDDPLLKRYEEANALDTARPDPALRDKVLAHARAAAEARRAPGAGRPRAANDGAWRWRALGGLAVLGLATLVVLQFDRGTEDEREVALSPRPMAPQREAASASESTPTPTPAQTPEPGATTGLHEAPPPARPPAAVLKPSAPAAANAEREQRAGPARPLSTTPRAAPPTPPTYAPDPNPAPPAPPAPSAVTAPAPTSPAESPPRPAPAPQEQATRSAELASDAALPRARGLAREEAPATLSSPRRATPPAMAPPPDTGLLAAAARGAQAEVRAALAQGADVNTTDAQRRTALMLAAQRGDAALVRLLLDAGADPQRTDANGQRAADIAQQAGHDQLLPLLETRGPR